MRDAPRKPDADADHAGSRKLVVSRDHTEGWISIGPVSADRSNPLPTDKVKQAVVEKGGSRTRPDDGKLDGNERARGGLARTGPEIGDKHD